MKKFISILVIVTASSLLIGCASNNVRRFNPDPLHNKSIAKNITRQISVKVIMPKDDKNAILCRMVGNIYLPSKMTYSKYIEDAFVKTLLSAGRLNEKEEADPKAHSLLVTLTKVDFSSTSGKWFIDAEVVVNNNAPVIVKSSTKFGTSWIAESACRNVSGAFDEAVGHFVYKVLSNHTIISYIK